jgi:dihydroorotate dehydrogenase (fumarate)
VKRAVRIPVIASLNGSTPGGWLSYAALMEEAGADAIELNPLSHRHRSGRDERRHRTADDRDRAGR